MRDFESVVRGVTSEFCPNGEHVYVHGTAVTGEPGVESDFDFSIFSPVPDGNAGGGLGEQSFITNDESLAIQQCLLSGSIDYVSIGMKIGERRVSIHLESFSFRRRLTRGFATELRPNGNRKGGVRSQYTMPLIDSTGSITLGTLSCPRIALPSGATINTTPQTGAMDVRVEANGLVLIVPKYPNVIFSTQTNDSTPTIGNMTPQVWLPGLQLSKIFSDTPLRPQDGHATKYRSHILEPIRDALVSLADFGINDPYILIEALKALNEARRRTDGSLRMNEEFFRMMRRRIQQAQYI